MKDKRILFIGMKPKRSVQRYVECEIEKWIEREQSALMPGRAEYQIKVEREETHPFYHCSIDLGLGPCTLKAQEGGRSLHVALSNALRRLRVTTSPRIMKNMNVRSFA